MVYVDDMRAQYGRMVMCHMIADTREELLDMAEKIGVSAKWLQKSNTWQEHFDICLSKKEKALNLGAKLITRKELVQKLLAKRSKK